MTAPSKEVGFSPRHQVKGRERAKAEALELDALELRNRIGALRFLIDECAMLTRAGVRSERKTPLQLLALSAKLLEECAEHLAKRC
jgi:hypothetical protein